MGEAQANQKIWDAIRKNLLEEGELKEAWEQEADGFGFATFEEYIDGRILKAMRAEVERREQDGLQMFKDLPKEE